MAVERTLSSLFTRRATGGCIPLILGYQKSGATPTGHPARRCGSFGEKTSRSAAVATSRAAAGFGGRRFLVPQYEEAAKDCCCAGSNTRRIALHIGKQTIINHVEIS